MPLETPVALLLYNRPVQTAQLLAAVRHARPQRLLVVADGPNDHRVGDARSVADVRAAIARVDWPCEVQTNYSPVNLGCKRRVATGLSWVFEQVEEAIILEDDCIPSRSFFPFCEELLERYRDDPRILSIGGATFHEEFSRTPCSYYFSKYFLCWGWASWRRAWQHFDVALREWPAWKSNGGLRSMAESPQEDAYWRKTFDALHAGQIDSWAFANAFASFRLGGLHVQPAINLVSNVGCDAAATHTGQGHRLANLPAKEWRGELIHPPVVERHAAADRHTFTDVYQGYRPPRWQRLLGSAVKRLAPIREAWKSLINGQRRRRLKGRLSAVAAPRIVIGECSGNGQGWIATDIQELNLLHPKDWSAVCSPDSLAAILAEHVWQHLTVAEGLAAAETCYRFLKPGGYVRVAVPDGCHPDPQYLDGVRPHGTGPGADRHRVLYQYSSLRALFERAGFEVKLLEYFDGDGQFHALDWDAAEGVVCRSRRFNPQNESGHSGYSSIILDAIKPLTAQFANRVPRNRAA